MNELKTDAMSIQLTKLEQEAMKWLLDGNDTVLDILREQFVRSKIAKHEMTGTGFFVKFNVPDDAKRVRDKRSFEIDDVNAEIEGLEHGSGFILFVREGTISSLEGFSYEEKWPETIEDFNFSYMGSHKRNVASLLRAWRSADEH